MWDYILPVSTEVKDLAWVFYGVERGRGYIFRIWCWMTISEHDERWLEYVERWAKAAVFASHVGEIDETDIEWANEKQDSAIKRLTMI